MKRNQLLEIAVLLAFIPLVFIFWALSDILFAAPQTGNDLSENQIENLTYNPTPGAVQFIAVGRGITTPQAPSTIRGTTQIRNLTYNATAGAIQAYLDLSSFDYTATNINQQSYSIASASRAGNYTLSYPSTGASTITLMSDMLVAGRTVQIQDTSGAAGTNNVTIRTQGAEKIMGGDSLFLQSNYAALTLASDGSHWFVSDKQGIVRSDLNLVTNGDCTSVDGWTAVNGSLASVAGGQAGNACELTYSSGSNQYFYRDIATVLGRSYQLSLYVKSGTSGNEASRVNPADAATTYPVWYTQKNTTGSWVQYTFSFIATSTSTRLFIYKYSSTAGTMLFDTIEMYGLL